MSEKTDRINYIQAKTIVTTTKKPASWFGYEYNMNIYKGCSHSCIYCDSRSDCYRIENFEEVKVKENALEIIRNDLRRKARKGIVATGAMSDPYNPLECELKLTRHSLELINACGFGASVTTKSHSAVRDIDVLEDIKNHSPSIVKYTITTIDDKLCRIIEPYASLSSQRFDALSSFSEKGIITGILLMPVLPYITDNPENILSIVKRANECGVRFIYPGFGVTLRSNQRQWYYNELDKSFPGIKDKYIKKYGERYSCTVPNVKSLYKAFTEECDKYGIIYDMRTISRLFRTGYEYEQLSLTD